MSVCPLCGHTNAGHAKFCSECGGALTAAKRVREERKVVTVLFADLVGFTSRAERLDPEDVRAVLAPYWERLRAELERHGGTVEKFIGDAVMALFGAPVAHEDDAERAVRAAIAIRDWAREQEGIQVRIGVNTGEALVLLGARPADGEGMAAGDVVNTAARLQTAAPENGVLVSEATFRATCDRISYQGVDPVTAKGKAEPLRVWEAVEPLARVGTEAVSTRAPLVGRARELDQLVDAFERVRQERSPQLVTLIGVPGIGKSRLVAELFAYVEALPELVYWRHGRSLPYGEGVTFWAFAEMVKAQAGILETDSPEIAAEKLQEAVAHAVDEMDRRWVETKLMPMIAPGGEVGGDRDDVFAAWRRFLEALAEQRPLVLVFEDLHWAGEELLDFVDQLPDWLEDVRLLVVCTARPELLDRRPGWAGGKRNALTISLAPLAEDDAARLIAALLRRAVLPAEIQTELLARAAGNPLYAEQFVRMFMERGELVGELPATVQGIIAARLDSLAEREKRLLQDAAVVGKVFWNAALAAVGGDDRAAIEPALRALVRKEFIRRERRTSVGGETEFSFVHALVRDVAYGQIPRAERAQRHLRTAAWIEELGRPDDQAELLAHHYLTALELLRNIGVSTVEHVQRAQTAARAAGARALSLSAYSAAARWFEAADGLGEGPAPPRTALQHALALHALADPRRFDLLEDARAALLAAGDIGGAADADIALTEGWWWAARTDRSEAVLKRAAMLAGESSTPVSVRAALLAQLARFQSLSDDHERAIRTARESLRLAEQGDDVLRAKNLITIGTALGHMADGDKDEAFEQIRAGIDLAAECGNWMQRSRGLTNLAVLSEWVGELDLGLAACLEAERLAQRRGHVPGIRFAAGNVIDGAFVTGDWAEVERRALAFRDAPRAEEHYIDSLASLALGFIHLARDETAEARADVERALGQARAIGSAQVLMPALAVGAYVHAELADEEAARALLSEFDPGYGVGTSSAGFFAAARCGIRDLVWPADEGAGTIWATAGRHVLSGRFAEAAALYEQMGARPFAALAGLRAAEPALLERSLGFWRSVAAARYVREGETVLARTA